MADALLLASTRVIPCASLASGFFFKDREIGATLQRIVKEKL
jgi:NAD dependent epimerase/dehydratase family enzyme